jgi:hypothetical protein
LASFVAGDTGGTRNMSNQNIYRLMMMKKVDSEADVDTEPGGEASNA